MKVALLYNLRDEFPSAWRCAHDSDADWEEPSTVRAISEGLSRAGHEVADLGNPLRLTEPEVRANTDLVFNLCEMHGVRHREAIVPAMCEFFNLPYSFSPPDAMIAALDKNLANLLVRQAGGYVPDWLLFPFISTADSLQALLDGGPVIVKPVAGGGGMGISASAVGDGKEVVFRRVEHVHLAYQQPALVQRFASGPELTVGVLETDEGPIALQPIEVTDPDGGPLSLYGHEQKEAATRLVRWRPVACDRLNIEAQQLALLSFSALGCRGAARIDMRQDPTEGSLGFLEANPLPHLHPEVGDFCRSASAAGWTYVKLLEAIVAAAIRNHAARQAPA